MFRIFLILAFAVFPSLAVMAQSDLIMFRDGTEKKVKIVQVNNQKTVYKESASKKAPDFFVDNTKIYMIKYKSRGNVFFNEAGERMFGSNSGVAVQGQAALIYFVKGVEEAAYNVSMYSGVVTYETKRKKGKLKSATKSEIFLIKYPDGTKDILTDLVPQMEDVVVQQPTAQDSLVEVSSETVSVQPVVQREYPCKATIITTRNKRLKVFICAEDAETVSYKKVNTAKASIFKLSRKNIESINYQD